VLTINPGIFQKQKAQELEEEKLLQQQDELEILELQSRNKMDVHKEAWDEVVEKKEDDNNDDDAQEQKKDQVEVEQERLPRVGKPVGDVLEVIMKLDIGEKQVETLK